MTQLWDTKNRKIFPRGERVETSGSPNHAKSYFLFFKFVSFFLFYIKRVIERSVFLTKTSRRFGHDIAKNSPPYHRAWSEQATTEQPAIVWFVVPRSYTHTHTQTHIAAVYLCFWNETRAKVLWSLFLFRVWLRVARGRSTVSLRIGVRGTRRCTLLLKFLPLKVYTHVL